ncbi:hypothetical protein QE152_g38595 [Popillia japonica]|uniref:Uncharacterized protein n=1 Tax=Popillia japonica TaxID=7064 RepID=A0AAW1HWV2_POPJA
MFFPLAFLSEVMGDFKTKEKGDAFLKRFNVSKHGGYELYKRACKRKWTMAGKIENTQAAQIVFHSIFGTVCEDLGVLSQITNTKKWYTREERWALHSNKVLQRGEL